LLVQNIVYLVTALHHASCLINTKETLNIASFESFHCHSKNTRN